MILAFGNPCRKPVLGNFFEIQEEMFCIPQFQCAFIGLAPGIYQFAGAFEQCIAIVTLVTSGPSVPADRACTFNVAIRQKPLHLWRVHLRRHPSV